MYNPKKGGRLVDSALVLKEMMHRTLYDPKALGAGHGATV